MAKKSKLLAALDAHKGRDYEAEKRAKKVKAAEKRKRQRVQSSNDDSGVVFNGEKRVSSTKDEQPPSEQEHPAGQDEYEFEDFLDDDCEEAEQEDVVNADDGPSASEAEIDSDVPLSELSEEDCADTVPHQRLTINNIAALIASTKRVAVTRPKMKFSAHNSLVLTSLPPASTSIPDPNDDLTRELEFYRICRTAATDARTLLKKEKVLFTRPTDYFAEMVKSDEHMGNVKKKMYDEAANKKAASEARRVRDAKKFGKAVQIAREQERAKEKRQTLEKISSLKRSMICNLPNCGIRTADIYPQNEKAKTQGPSTKERTFLRASTLKLPAESPTVGTGPRKKVAANSSVRNETRSSDTVGRSASQRVAMRRAQPTCEVSRPRK
jgi:rRNA-processing protein EBP2